MRNDVGQPLLVGVLALHTLFAPTSAAPSSFVRAHELATLPHALSSQLETEFEGLSVHVEEGGRDALFQDLGDRFRLHHRAKRCYNAEHADVENDRLPYFVHHRLVHGKLFLHRVDRPLDLDIACVSDQKPSRADDGRELVIRLLGETNQYIGLLDIGKVDR